MFKKLIGWSMVASLFMDDFIIMRYILPFDFYVYYLIFIVFLSYYFFKSKGSLLLPKWFAIPVIIIIFTSIIISYFGDNFGFSVIKQIIGIVFTSVAYYAYLRYENFDIPKVFRMYLILAFIVSAYGVMEEGLHFAGIHISGNIKKQMGFYRVYSIMGEPYFLAVVLIPALFYLLSSVTYAKLIYSFKNRVIFLVIVLLCYVFTFSSAGFIGLALMIAFWLYNKKYLSLLNWRILFLPLLIIFLLAGFGKMQDTWKEFTVKTTETIKAFTAKNMTQKDASNLNSSSFALYSNFLVAKSSFDAHPLVGSGLGTHGDNYKKRFALFFDKSFVVRYGTFNTSDANSLFLRLMSETGLMGLGMFFIFLFKYFAFKKGYDDKELRIYTLVNQGIFIWFIVRLVRTGNYFGNGFFFFFFLYYLSAKFIYQKLKEQKEQIKQIESN